MQKKGASHADWAISLGIFLVYVLALFIMIQPGVLPVYRNDNLMNIVKTEFLNNQIKFTKTPIYIYDVEANSCNLGDGVLIEISEDLGIDNFNNYRIFDGNDYLKANFNKNLIFNTKTLGEGVNKYFLLYSEDESVFKGDEENGKECDDLTYNYAIGSEETFKGFSEEKLENLECDNEEAYNKLKEDWNFPINKDFMFSIYDGADFEYSDPKYQCSSPQVYEQADVFVDEFIIYVFDEYGKLKPMRVNMRVW